MVGSNIDRPSNTSSPALQSTLPLAPRSCVPVDDRASREPKPSVGSHFRNVEGRRACKANPCTRCTSTVTFCVSAPYRDNPAVLQPIDDTAQNLDRCVVTYLFFLRCHWKRFRIEA